MANYLLPNIGAVGAITLLPPFNGLCASNVPYEVTGLRRLRDLAASGADPFATFYQPAEIDQAKFLEDIRDGVCIITLLGPDGQSVEVPNSYLANLPVATGVPYATMMIGVKIGSLPLDLSLAYLMAKFKELAHDLVGAQNVDVRAARASSITYLSIDDAEAVETARKNVMSTVVTTDAKLHASEQARIALQERNADLEAYILAHHPPA